MPLEDFNYGNLFEWMKSVGYDSYDDPRFDTKKQELIQKVESVGGGVEISRGYYSDQRLLQQNQFNLCKCTIVFPNKTVEAFGLTHSKKGEFESLIDAMKNI